MEEGIQVKRFKCICGKSRLHAVIDPTGKPFSKESMKSQVELLKLGCDVETVTLEKARELEMCFECKL